MTTSRPTYPTHITVEDGRIVVRAPYGLKDALHAAGGWWEPARKAWCFPATPEWAVVVKGIIPSIASNPAFDDLAAHAVQPKSGYDARYLLECPEIPGLVGSSWMHQRRAYADAMTRDATMLALGLGAGKSRVAIGCIINRDVRRVLVLAPKSVVPVWPAEFERHTYPRAVLELSEGSVADKTRRAKRWIELPRLTDTKLIVVTNYDAARCEPFRSWSLEAGFDMVVLDESQRIKTPSGVTARYAWALGRKAKYRLCLSGTPAAHSPLDLFSQYKFLEPAIFGPSFVRFKYRYAIMGGYENHQVIGYQNVDELNRKFHSIAFQVGREVLDLPSSTTLTRYCELGPEGKRVYKELATNLWAQLDSGEITAANSMTALLRLQQLTGGYLSDDQGTLNEVDHAKRDLLAEVLEEIGPDEPVTIFCRFRRDLDTVREVAGEDTKELSGRRNQLAEWQGGNGRCLGVQIQAGGVGISLVRSAYVIFYSVGYSLSDFLQAQARAHRPGQDRPVTFIQLVAANTVDQTVYEALAQRRDVVEAVLARSV